MGRLIDADALKELFREVIGRIAKKPEMNGNLEHMIRASAMVIQMIDDAPTVQPELDIWKDGTLHISVSKGQLDKIGRVLVEENGTIFCKLFYQDAELERKTGHWILDRSGAYCCSKCMEPCAGYVMMKPRDKFCKMCGSRNEVTE